MSVLRSKRFACVLSLLVLLLARAMATAAVVDPYEQYVLTSKDFQPVKQDPAIGAAAFPTWTYMPWTYQWSIGYTQQAGEWSLAHGYNGAFVNGGDISADGSPTGRIDWINRFNFRFYMDHTAAKGYLHLWDGDDLKAHLADLHAGGVRTKPLNAEMFRTLQKQMRERIGPVKSSPNRAAYALDDEISWGHFIHPTMWCVTDDQAAYANWLHEIYGPNAAARDRWITYEDIRPKLAAWTIAQFDASPLMDQWTFNDSYWNNFAGDLVTYANTIDPKTPCGFVGGQAPNAFGGYDYAKVMRKVQFIESYNLGSSQAIIRSFNPHNAVPAVTTHFHKSVDDDIWQTWYYLAHGNRGFIGWVENWFDGKTPKPWHEQVAPQYIEAEKKIGPLLHGAEWIHDGVAIYYSHPSIQLGWILDAAAHGKTWTNRNGDERLGSSHLGRHAWENMLRDEGLQYNFISYADVIQHGIPAEYKSLILPACLCLSDAEAKRIEAFCEAGGTVIADFLPGVWDQHGKGRANGGVLDAMFGVKHDPATRSSDLFGGSYLWCEIDQDANFSWKTYAELMSNRNACVRAEGGFDKAVRAMPTQIVHKFGKGTAVLLNLSPQHYNAYREDGFESARARNVFMEPVVKACGKPWVRIKNAGEREHGYEVTYWSKAGRTIVCLCLNPEIVGTSTGGGNAAKLRSDVLKITLQSSVRWMDARNERTGQVLGDGSEFTLDWKMNEAVVLSFKNGSARVK